MNHKFKLVKVTNLKEAVEGKELIIPESDFSIKTESDHFLQFELANEEKRTDWIAEPGLFQLVKTPFGVVVESAIFLEEATMSSYSHTALIEKRVDQFFSKLHIYDKRKRFPLRAALLYGQPGSGKSLAISKVCNKYLRQKDTLVIIWHTDRLEASDVSSFLSNVEYPETVKRFILVAEDIGGGETDVRHSRSVDSSLLSLLDNTQKTFKIPTMILATTNFPENLLTNLTDRPQRFDDTIDIGAPDSTQRAAFLKFFTEDGIDDTVLTHIQQSKYDGLSVAHLKEIIIRAELYDISYIEAADQVKKQSDKAKNFFAKSSNRVGIRHDDEDYD